MAETGQTAKIDSSAASTDGAQNTGSTGTAPMPAVERSPTSPASSDIRLETDQEQRMESQRPLTKQEKKQARLEKRLKKAAAKDGRLNDDTYLELHHTAAKARAEMRSHRNIIHNIISGPFESIAYRRSIDRTWSVLQENRLHVATNQMVIEASKGIFRKARVEQATLENARKATESLALQKLQEIAKEGGKDLLQQIIDRHPPSQKIIKGIAQEIFPTELNPETGKDQTENAEGRLKNYTEKVKALGTENGENYSDEEARALAEGMVLAAQKMRESGFVMQDNMRTDATEAAFDRFLQGSLTPQQRELLQQLVLVSKKRALLSELQNGKTAFLFGAGLMHFPPLAAGAGLVLGVASAGFSAYYRVRFDELMHHIDVSKGIQKDNSNRNLLQKVFSADWESIDTSEDRRAAYIRLIGTSVATSVFAFGLGRFIHNPGEFIHDIQQALPGGHSEVPLVAGFAQPNPDGINPPPTAHTLLEDLKNFHDHQQAGNFKDGGINTDKWQMEQDVASLHDAKLQTDLNNYISRGQTETDYQVFKTDIQAYETQHPFGVFEENAAKAGESVHTVVTDIKSGNLGSEGLDKDVTQTHLMLQSLPNGQKLDDEFTKALGEYQNGHGTGALDDFAKQFDELKPHQEPDLGADGRAVLDDFFSKPIPKLGEQLGTLNQHIFDRIGEKLDVGAAHDIKADVENWYNNTVHISGSGTTSVAADQLPNTMGVGGSHEYPPINPAELGLQSPNVEFNGDTLHHDWQHLFTVPVKIDDQGHIISDTTSEAWKNGHWAIQLHGVQADPTGQTGYIGIQTPQGMMYVQNDSILSPDVATQVHVFSDPLGQHEIPNMNGALLAHYEGLNNQTLENFYMQNDIFKQVVTHHIDGSTQSYPTEDGWSTADSQDRDFSKMTYYHDDLMREFAKHNLVPMKGGLFADRLMYVYQGGDGQVHAISSMHEFTGVHGSGTITAIVPGAGGNVNLPGLPTTVHGGLDVAKFVQEHPRLGIGAAILWIEGTGGIAMLLGKNAKENKTFTARIVIPSAGAAALVAAAIVTNPYVALPAIAGFGLGLLSRGGAQAAPAVTTTNPQSSGGGGGLGNRLRGLFGGNRQSQSTTTTSQPASASSSSQAQGGQANTVNPQSPPPAPPAQGSTLSSLVPAPGQKVSKQAGQQAANIFNNNNAGAPKVNRQQAAAFLPALQAVKTRNPNMAMAPSAGLADQLIVGMNGKGPDMTNTANAQIAASEILGTETGRIPQVTQAIQRRAIADRAIRDNKKRSPQEWVQLMRYGMNENVDGRTPSPEQIRRQAEAVKKALQASRMNGEAIAPAMQSGFGQDALSQAIVAAELSGFDRPDQLKEKMRAGLQRGDAILRNARGGVVLPESRKDLAHAMVDAYGGKSSNRNHVVQAHQAVEEAARAVFPQEVTPTITDSLRRNLAATAPAPAAPEPAPGSDQSAGEQRETAADVYKNAYRAFVDAHRAYKTGETPATINAVDKAMRDLLETSGYLIRDQQQLRNEYQALAGLLIENDPQLKALSDRLRDPALNANDRLALQEEGEQVWNERIGYSTLPQDNKILRKKVWDYANHVYSLTGEQPDANANTAPQATVNGTPSAQTPDQNGDANRTARVEAVQADATAPRTAESRGEQLKANLQRTYEAFEQARRKYENDTGLLATENAQLEAAVDTAYKAVQEAMQRIVRANNIPAYNDAKVKINEFLDGAEIQVVKGNANLAGVQHRDERRSAGWEMPFSQLEENNQTLFLNALNKTIETAGGNLLPPEPAPPSRPAAPEPAPAPEASGEKMENFKRFVREELTKGDTIDIPDTMLQDIFNEKVSIGGINVSNKGLIRILTNRHPNRPLTIYPSKGGGTSLGIIGLNDRQNQLVGSPSDGISTELTPLAQQTALFLEQSITDAIGDDYEIISYEQPFANRILKVKVRRKGGSGGSPAPTSGPVMPPPPAPPSRPLVIGLPQEQSAPSTARADQTDAASTQQPILAAAPAAPPQPEQIALAGSEPVAATETVAAPIQLATFAQLLPDFMAREANDSLLMPSEAEIHSLALNFVDTFHGGLADITQETMMSRYVQLERLVLRALSLPDEAVRTQTLEQIAEEFRLPAIANVVALTPEEVFAEAVVQTMELPIVQQTQIQQMREAMGEASAKQYEQVGDDEKSIAANKLKQMQDVQRQVMDEFLTQKLPGKHFSPGEVQVLFNFGMSEQIDAQAIHQLADFGLQLSTDEAQQIWNDFQAFVKHGEGGVVIKEGDEYKFQPADPTVVGMNEVAIRQQIHDLIRDKVERDNLAAIETNVMPSVIVAEQVQASPQLSEELKAKRIKGIGAAAEKAKNRYPGEDIAKMVIDPYTDALINDPDIDDKIGLYKLIVHPDEFLEEVSSKYHHLADGENGSRAFSAVRDIIRQVYHGVDILDEVGSVVSTDHSHTSDHLARGLLMRMDGLINALYKNVPYAQAKLVPLQLFAVDQAMFYQYIHLRYGVSIQALQGEPNIDEMRLRILRLEKAKKDSGSIYGILVRFEEGLQGLPKSTPSRQGLQAA